jgi:hypothetical protein
MSRKSREGEISMTNRIIIEAKGSNGAILVYDDRVVITRATAMGFLAQGFTGDRTIFYSDIASVDFRCPTFINNGYIKFLFAGSKDEKKVTLASDPNAVTLRAFSRENVDTYQQAYNNIMANIAKSRQTNENKKPSVDSNIDQLMKLADLRDKGILTETEFASEKKKILGK